METGSKAIATYFNLSQVRFEMYANFAFNFTCRPGFRKLVVSLVAKKHAVSHDYKFCRSPWIV